MGVVWQSRGIVAAGRGSLRLRCHRPSVEGTAGVAIDQTGVPECECREEGRSRFFGVDVGVVGLCRGPGFLSWTADSTEYARLEKVGMIVARAA